MTDAAGSEELAHGVFRIADTCNVYLIKSPDRPEGIAIDFGSGRVLDHLRAAVPLAVRP